MNTDFDLNDDEAKAWAENEANKLSSLLDGGVDEWEDMETQIMTNPDMQEVGRKWSNLFADEEAAAEILAERERTRNPQRRSSDVSTTSTRSRNSTVSRPGEQPQPQPETVVPQTPGAPPVATMETAPTQTASDKAAAAVRRATRRRSAESLQAMQIAHLERTGSGNLRNRTSTAGVSLEDLKKQVVILQTKLKILQKERDEAKISHQKGQEEAERLEAELKKKEKHLMTKEEETTKLHTRYEETKKELEGKVAEMEKSLSDMEGEHTSKNQEWQEKKEAYEQDVAQLTERVATLKEKLEASEVQFSSREEALQLEATELRSDMNAKEQEKQQFVKRYNQVSEKLEESVARAEELQFRVDELEASNFEEKTQRANIGEEMLNLTAELKDLNVTGTFSLAKIEQLDLANRALEDDNSEMEKRLTILETHNSELRAERDVALSELRLMKDRDRNRDAGHLAVQAALEEKVQSLIERGVSLEESHEQMLATIVHQEEEMKEKEKENTQKDARNQRHITELNEAITEWKSRHDALAKRLQEASLEMETAVGEMYKSSNVSIELSEKLFTKRHDNMDLQGKKAVLSSEVSRLNRKIEESQTLIEELRKDVISRDEELTRLQLVTASHQTSLATSEGEFVELSEQLRVEMDGKIEQMRESYEKEKKAVINDLQQLEVRAKQMLELNDRLTEDVEIAKGERDEEKKKGKDLAVKYADEQKTKTAVETSLAALTAASKLLDEQKESLSSRVSELESSLEEMREGKRKAEALTQEHLVRISELETQLSNVNETEDELRMKMRVIMEENDRMKQDVTVASQKVTVATSSQESLQLELTVANEELESLRLLRDQLQVELAAEKERVEELQTRQELDLPEILTEAPASENKRGMCTNERGDCMCIVM